MDKEELAELFERFLCEIGQYRNFKEWAENQGYTLEELGMTDEE